MSITREEVETIIAVELREKLRLYVPIVDEMFMSIVIEYKNPNTGEITTIREPKS